MVDAEPPGPVSNAGRSSTLDSDLALLSPRPPAAVDGRRGSTPLLRGTSSKPPHRVLRIVAKAPPPLDAAGSSTSRRNRPSRVIRLPSPSYSGLSDAARAVDGRRRALAAVLGRLRSIACPAVRSRRTRGDRRDPVDGPRRQRLARARIDPAAIVVVQVPRRRRSPSRGSRDSVPSVLLAPGRRRSGRRHGELPEG